MAIANSVDAGTTGFQSLTSGGIWNGRTLTAGSGINITNGDGTAGNPVISATGGSGGVNATLDFWDDFIQSSDSSDSGDTQWVPGGLTTPVAVSGRPGTIALAQSGFIYKGDSANFPTIILGAGVLTITWYIKMSALTSYTIWVGLGDLTVAGEPTNGVYFLGSNSVNSGNWVGKTANAGTRSSANSSTAVAADWRVLQIVVNAAASSVAYYVGTTLAGLAQIANSPLATNIPTAAITPYAALVAGATGNLQIDLVTMTYALTTVR